MAKMDRKRRGGRPATGKGEQVVVRMQRELLVPLDEHVAATNAKSRAAAIRELLLEFFKRRSMM